MTLTMKLLASFGIAALVDAGSLNAQATDARWAAWIGCWAPVAGQGSAPRELGGSARVCVVPVQGASAVDIVSVASGKVVDRTRIDADGVPHTVSRDGCNGTETATFSAHGSRVYLNSTVACSGGVTQRGKGVMSFTQHYEWMDVRGMASTSASGIAVARYAATDDTTGIPAEVRNAVPARSAATNNALLAASAPMTLADIADVALTSDSGVTATWLMERTQGVKLSVNGQQLEALADQGVPPSVIDVVVALAHPQVFALNPGSREAEFRAGGQQVTSGVNRAMGISTYPTLYGYPYGFAYGWSPYSMYGYYNPYYYSAYPGYGYGYPGLGYGYYSPYVGYYAGSQPIIVVTRGSDDTPRPHGRVVKGEGYVGPQSSGSSSTSSSGSSGSTSGASGSSSGSAGGSTSSSGGSTGRTAVRKPPQE